MRKCSKCKVTKDLSAFGNNSRGKDGIDHCCRECRNRMSADYKARNREKIKAYNRKSYCENVEQHILKAKKWKEANPERWAESNRKSKQKWSRNNKSLLAAKSSARRALRLQATPPWLTEEQLGDIVDFYSIARLFKLYIGEDYHVDHIVPLKGKKVCGLHVPWNLQVLPAKENASKSNKFEV